MNLIFLAGAPYAVQVSINIVAYGVKEARDCVYKHLKYSIQLP